jgi:hypothetical protein
LDAFVESGLHNVVRALDVGCVHFGGVVAPEAIVSGTVVEYMTAARGPLERIQIAKVSNDELD